MPDYHAETNEIQLLTNDYVGQLIQIWTRIFDDAALRKNLRRLADHARNFYTELITESTEKRTYFELEITRLREEAQTLCRLLNVDVELPPETETPPPLLVLQTQMDSSLTKLREQLRERRAQICELLQQQEMLTEELDTTPRPLLDDPLPSAEELQEFTSYLKGLSELRETRLLRLSTLRREIKALQHSLELSTENEMEQRLLHQRDIKLSADTFVALELLHKDYTLQQQDMRDKINTMRRKLETLWRRLHEKPSAEHFGAPPSKYNQHTYDNYYAELQRCEQLRSANVKCLVQQIRAELTEWWARTLKSTQECERFTHSTSNCYTDDLLHLHEMELEELKQHYEQNKKIFQLYADRRTLWDRMCALEAKASDPNRFNNRGGQLLKEERERRQIETRMPKIEQEIGALVVEYEQRENTPFLVHGKSIMQLMADEWAHKQEQKETKSSARKLAVSPDPSLAHSRAQLSGGRKPTSTMKKSSSVSNLNKEPSSTTSTHKRKLNTAAEHNATPIVKHSRPSLSSPSVFLKPGTSSAGSVSAATSSAHKRKLKTAVGHHTTHITKRSLKHALSSPSVFLKPDTSSNAAVPHGHVRRIKSPRVIATTIRRSACGNSKKRRSMSKKPSSSECTGGSGDSRNSGGADDTYGSFEKCIESASRSSILPTSTEAADAKSQADSAPNYDEENKRLAQLPKPLHPHTQTPSRKPKPMRIPSIRLVNGGDSHLPGTSNSGSSRKLKKC